MKRMVGIFVGGRARRFGGTKKGLLPAPDGRGTLVERLAAVTRETWPGCDVVLVGSDDAYAGLGFEIVPDDPAGIGPIGGLRALLDRAARASSDAVALACDLPFVTGEVLALLEPQGVACDAVAPRVDGVWQPLCAFYRAGACLGVVDRVIAGERRALYAVIEELGERVEAIEVGGEEALLLGDWDEPGDLRK